MKNKSTQNNGKALLFSVLTIEMCAIFLCGCGRPTYIDVTSLPKYNFSSLAGTTWRTKTNMAIVDVKRYTGKHELFIAQPSAFDPKDPHYRPVPYGKTIVVLPAGTHLQIDRLMRDNGNWGGLQVAVKVDDKTYSQKTVYILEELLVDNIFLGHGRSSLTNWDVNPELLEK